MGALLDLTGKTINSWTVLKREKNDKYRKATWLCRCKCGTERIVSGPHLNSGHSKSCGCHLQEMVEDLTGKRFGIRTVISMEPDYQVRWRCDCGKEGICNKYAIQDSKSCGCLNLDVCRDKILLPDNQALKNSTYAGIKASAIGRGYSFDLSFEEFLLLSQKPCFYCGAEPSNISKDDRGREVRTWKYQGLDRVDNLKGYEPTNIVPCCIICNKAKATMGQSEFLSWIEQVHKHTWKNREYVKDLKINVKVIPHSEQGPSKICAQWYWDEKGEVQVLISRVGNLDMERLLIAHEVIEVLSSAHFPGMEDSNTDKIDAEFLEKRNAGELPKDEIEPGFWHKTPYKWPHTLSTGVELILAAWLGVDWLEYQRRLDEVSFEGKEFEF